MCLKGTEEENLKISCTIVDKTIGTVLPNDGSIIIFFDQTIIKLHCIILYMHIVVLVRDCVPENGFLGIPRISQKKRVLWQHEYKFFFSFFLSKFCRI